VSLKFTIVSVLLSRLAGVSATIKKECGAGSDDFDLEGHLWKLSIILIVLPGFLVDV